MELSHLWRQKRLVAAESMTHFSTFAIVLCCAWERSTHDKSGRLTESYDAVLQTCFNGSIVHRDQAFWGLSTGKASPPPASMNLLRPHSQDATDERMESMKPARMEKLQYKGIVTHSLPNLSYPAIISCQPIDSVQPLWQTIAAITFQTRSPVVQKLAGSHLCMRRCVSHASCTV